MKHLYLTLAFFLAATAAMAQRQLTVALKDGSAVKYNIADIDSITFQSATPQPATIYYKVSVPTDFSKSFVLDILNAAGDKVAEACSEYVRSYNNADGTATVLYAADADGKAVLSKGYDATHSAFIQWDTEADSIAQYTPADAATTLYISTDGDVLTALPDGTTAEETTAAPSLLNDVRGTEQLAYAIVKIGVQYWMAENLKATRYANGTAIQKYTTSQLAAWKATTDGAYHMFADDADSQDLYGLMYNGYAVVAEAGLAPEGWEVPETADYDKMKKYLKTASGTKLKAVGEYDWTDGGATKYNPTNLTNFTAHAAGYFNAAGDGDADMGTNTWFWTRTDTYEFRQHNYGSMRLYYKNTGLITTGYHAPTFGQYVRCIRKN